MDFIQPAMDPLEIIRRYYRPGTRTYEILVRHSASVAVKAHALAGIVGHLNPDTDFIHEAAMLHDIGICRTRTPVLYCFGDQPYIRHGLLGRRMLEEMALPRHARVCERHVGAGILADEIRREALPLPRRDMLPVTIEEIIVCYADKFFSKNGNGSSGEKPLEAVLKGIGEYGPEALERFSRWGDLFGGDGESGAQTAVD